jgi:Lsr2
MATQVLFVDDLGGIEGDVETVLYGFDGQDYEIDLPEANVEKFRTSPAAYFGRSGGFRRPR